MLSSVPSSSHLLTLAQQKLQVADIPFELRVAYYLRLSCAALKHSSVTYTNLMQALFSHDRHWIATCRVSSTGLLTSSDPTIEVLLSVVTDLHQPKLQPEQDLMAA
ncbi:hypothetical protein [Leptolyngbya ohadii]|uniref:hypothetical protein n=1 Tax=Leptolyngbya ohadii TaxID=1962290 RepID=UPI001179B7FD|nr:hypothetical protein [Leptolyngbya ohadii]